MTLLKKVLNHKRHKGHKGFLKGSVESLEFEHTIV